MKLKQTASGDSGVPQESRVYLSIQLPSDSLEVSQKSSAYWLDKVTPHAGSLVSGSWDIVPNSLLVYCIIFNY